MSDHVTAKYLSSLARVGRDFGLKELEVCGVRLVFGGGGAAVARKPVAQPDQAQVQTHHAHDEIDVDALEDDPKFLAFSRLGANPVA